MITLSSLNTQQRHTLHQSPQNALHLLTITAPLIQTTLIRLICPKYHYALHFRKAEDALLRMYTWRDFMNAPPLKMANALLMGLSLLI